ncbi:haloacid dehalogenase-like hydrolase [Streptomyces sp. ID05-04B]|uniref:haloacid dehalogenase-like hydrolase n=1 Tax=Streptomyces sp. ID05-04B TaxID=3028661 RepID=UPI0029C46B67|nr:haloacid dehalogenase-like hydrolase [Streptomyces sp. ID05-04B]MDX5569132.1 haloacid dehalogenase-like hydrolase [Streptomyces sp. ID05-04B]
MAARRGRRFGLSAMGSALAVLLIASVVGLWPPQEATAASPHGKAVVDQLRHWPAPVAEKLGQVIADHAHQGEYAVFDADNTTYRYDLEESLLPYLEMRGKLKRSTMDPSLRLIPFKDTKHHKESLYSYYNRLCEIDDQVCYPWVAQVFSGFTLKQLKGYVDDLLAYGKPVPAEYYDGDRLTQTQVQPPQFYRGMQELYHVLRDNGIEVYVVSAAGEELVRDVLSDPAHGYGAEPQNVIGVSMLLKDPVTGKLTTARKEISEGRYDPRELADDKLTSSLWAPLTWFQGKPAAISTYIDQWRKPILVAGDTPVSDGPMLFQSLDVEHGGARIWVNRKDKYLTQIQDMQKANAARQEELGQPVTADKNWLVVEPDEIR